MELDPQAIDAILDRWPIAALATAGDRGPHTVPIVFARAAGALWSPIDGKPKRSGELARIRHIRRDPRASLLFSNYDEDWTLLWWLRVDGEAEARRAPAAGWPADEADALAALRRKYPQYARVPLLGPDALLLRIGVTRQRSWCASEAGGAALLAYLCRSAD
jgi:PPOX class probable F420-dependent enzyme